MPKIFQETQRAREGNNRRVFGKICTKKLITLVLKRKGNKKENEQFKSQNLKENFHFSKINIFILFNYP